MYLDPSAQGPPLPGSPLEVHVDHPKGNLDAFRGDDGTIRTSHWNPESSAQDKDGGTDAAKSSAKAKTVTGIGIEETSNKTEEELNDVPAHKGSL